MTRRRPRLPVRRTGAGIEVALPEWMTSMLLSSVHDLRDELETPGTAASQRLLAPLDESATSDDPVVTLMRQHALDDVLDTVLSTARSAEPRTSGPRLGGPRTVLSDAEAETWLEALGLLLAARTAQLGLHTEHDRRALRRSDEAFVQVVYLVQLGLIDALDAPPPPR